MGLTRAAPRARRTNPKTRTIMGVMAAPAVKITGLLMAPFYISLFYTVNTFVFGLGLMDSMLETMLGTPAEMVTPSSSIIA